MRVAAALALAGILAPPAPAPPGERERLAAWARLYGVVRWFHPTDAATEVDWDRLAVEGVKAARAAQSRPQLERALRELVAPSGAGIVIGGGLLPAGSPARAVTPLVAWRHLGFGLGAHSGGIYQSVRTHRSQPGAIDGFATLMQTVPGVALRGRRIRLTARVKAEAAGQDGAAALWLRVDRGETPGFFDNMHDRPIRSPQWREYAIEGTVDGDATQVAFGVMAQGRVRAGFDAASLSVGEGGGAWRPLEIADPGFEGEAGWFRAGNSRAAVVSRERGDAPEGRQWLALRSDAATALPFDAPLRAGHHADVDLGAGVRARVPLVLADAEAKVNAEQERLLAAPRANAVTRAAGDRDVLLADVIVAWNLFRHFYPYWPETGVDWEAKLPALLQAALAAAPTREAHLTVLRRLVAEARDGHGSVADPAPRGPRGVLPIAVRGVAGRWVVIASTVPDTVRPGDVVVAVDGRKRWLEEEEALQSGSPQWRREGAARALAWGVAGDRVRLQLERAGATVTAELTRRSGEAAPEKRPEKVGEIRPGVWYVDLTRADWAAIEPHLARIAGARAVVFDVRGYPTDAGARILPHLVTAPERARWMHVPHFVEPFAQIAGWQDHGWDIAPASPRIGGQVAFLTDGRAISYAESVMGYVEDLRLGAIVGSPTAGTNGNVNSLALPSGMSVMFTGMRVTRHDGTPFHLAGVRPTLAVDPTLAGIQAGRDEVLERALDHLAR
jgi:hypothetical protein